MIRPYRGIYPRIAQTAYVDQASTVIGDVTMGERSSVWPSAVLRGDVNKIVIGDETNIQDGSVLHGELDRYPVILGNRVTVGHMVCLHGCVVEDDVLVGIGAIVLNGAKIGRGSVIAAGSLVPEGMEIPPESMVMGVPAKVRRQVTEEEKARFKENAQRYIRYRQDYRDEAAH
ncbi:gamma carbonic anhydrase family protein [Paludibaculum fermentans]|uniref:Gamma carbonic anhydrase family protein n=1 Tax=Paludibaculum fermentans TaxID=1473598 RepID=A0A7S7SKD1_PALFE|nr:gamma carbonic anhydrase family protein [Paludibaculum fermentans]QOY86905.1 gamma carbonic anhydrase family protein [Paludibaculum fermentans]